MSSNKSNKWKKVGGRSRSANYNSVRIPQQTVNIFNISDLMGKASTDNSTLGKINIHDNVAIQGTLDVSGSATGVTSTKTSGNEFATLDWVNGELNPTTLWTLHQNGNIIYNKNGTQVDIIGNTYNEGTSTFNGLLEVLSSFPLESSFFGLTNDTQDQSQSSIFGSSVAISNMNDSSYNIAVTSINHAEVYYTNSLGNAGTLGAKIDKNNDINFNNAIMGFNGSNQSIAISADGKIVIVGDSVHNCVYISMTNSDGSVKTVTITGEPITNDIYNPLSHFGYSVAVSSDGMWFVVGAPNYNSIPQVYGSGHGKAYVFKLTNTEANTLNINDISNVSVKGGGGMQMGNSVAIDASGNIITIGSELVAISMTTNPTKRGMMNIYKFVSNSQSSSSERDTLIEIDTSSGDIYQGYTLSEKYANSLSISADGTVLAVGAPGTSGENGSVYVYQIDGITASQIADVNYQSVSYVTWKLVKKILGKTGSSFGTSVSLNLAGNTLVAGGPTYVGSANGQGTGQGTGQGYVEVYAYVHSDWRLACPTIYQEFPNNLTLTYVPNTVAMFGSSVSISSNDGSNNMIVVGAPNNNLVSNTNGINNSNTDIGRGTIFTYTLNDIRSSIFTVDSGNNTSSFKGPVYIDRNGITVDPSDNEVVTAGWVKSKYGNGSSGLKYAEDDTVIQNLSSQLTNAQQLISQQGLTIDTMKSSLTSSYDKNTIDKLAKKIDITQQMINHHAQNVTNIKLNATSKMAIDELTRKLNDVQVVIDKQNEDIYRMSLQTRSNEEYIHKQNEDIFRMSLQTRSNEEFIFNYDMKYNDTMKQQSNLINDSQMRIRSQEKQVKGLCRNVNTHSTNIQSMKQMIMSVGGGVGSGTEPTIPK